MSRTITVAGDINAPDTRVVLTGQGSVTAPSLVIPAGVTKIVKILAAAGHDGAADNGSAAWFLRLNGSAVKNGEQTITFAGGGNQTVQTGSDAAPGVMRPFMLEDVDIDVQASEVITIAAEYGGVDIGDSAMVVTLVYA